MKYRIIKREEKFVPQIFSFNTWRDLYSGYTTEVRAESKINDYNAWLLEQDNPYEVVKEIEL